MAERIEAIKVSLNQTLNDKDKPWKKILDLAEEKSGVPRLYLFAGEFNCSLNWLGFVELCRYRKKQQQKMCT